MRQLPINTLAVSALLSAVLFSVESRPGVQLAGAGGLEVRAGQLAAGLTGSAPGSQPSVPTAQATRDLAAPRSAPSPNASEPLAVVAQIAETIGDNDDLNGRLCTMLGITQNNQKLPVKQLVIDISKNPEQAKDFNVWQTPGSSSRGVILVDFRGTEIFMYRTTSAGNFISAVHGVESGQPRVMPYAEAYPAFQKEVAWWLAKERELRNPRTASR